jgi:hypothetical protein
MVAKSWFATRLLPFLACLEAPNKLLWQKGRSFAQRSSHQPPGLGVSSGELSTAIVWSEALGRVPAFVAVQEK